jgi:hypothetical protein
MSELFQKFRNFLGSKTFFWLIITVFVLQAAWIAVSAMYPQAFDEDFHFGLVQVYSHYWLPFLSGQPPDANAYGAVARDPSFLYHYLMSFPYRLITLITDSQAVQIVLLRLFNVGFFAAGLVLFGRLLRRVKLSSAQTNLAIFVVTFLPIVPQLAGQVNYDNLLMPLAAWAMLLSLNTIDQIKARDISLQSLLLLITVCLIATMVKYQFLPIFLGILIFLAVLFWRTHHSNWPDPKRLLKVYKKHPWHKKALVLVAFLAVFSMFVDRDIVNLARYHDVAPDCGYILSYESCSAYPVWIHDYTTHQQVISHGAYVSSNPIWYVWEWTYWLWYRLFFAINGVHHHFRNYPPLPLPAATFVLAVLGSIAAIISFRKRLFKDNTYFRFFGVVVVLYLLVLLSQGYLKYRDTAVLQLMNGRYLLPVILPGAALGIAAIGYALRRHPRVKTALAAVLIIGFLQGGGVLTFMSRSDDSWYWDNQTIRTMNHGAQSAVHALVVDGSKTFGTRRWFFN